MHPNIPTLQEVVGKKRPFDSPAQEAHLNIVRTSQALASRELRFFKTYGLSPPGYNVLRILRASGDDGRTCTDIRNDLVSQVPDVTRLLDRLERAGLVERRRCTDDRRVVFAAITQKGLDLLERLDGPIMELHAKVLGHLDNDELVTLSRLLEKARAGLERSARKRASRHPEEGARFNGVESNDSRH